MATAAEIFEIIKNEAVGYTDALEAAAWKFANEFENKGEQILNAMRAAGVESKELWFAVKTDKGIIKYHTSIAEGDSPIKASIRALLYVSSDNFVDGVLSVGATSQKPFTMALALGHVTVADAIGDKAADAVDAWFDWNWDYYIGPSVEAQKLSDDNVRITSTGGSLSNILRQNWHNYDGWGVGVKGLKNYSSWTVESTLAGTSIRYKSDGNAIYLSEPMNSPNYRLTEVLHYLSGVGVVNFQVSFAGGALQKGVNYLGYITDIRKDAFFGLFSPSLNSSLFASKAKSDQKAFFALQNLQGYILESNYAALSDPKYDKNLFSDSYINDRATLAALNINAHMDDVAMAQTQNYMNDNLSVLFYDDTLGYFGRTTSKSGAHNPIIAFTDSNFTYDNAYGKSYTDVTVYGGNNANMITAKSRANNYVEGGLGNDTIITGMGNDTIYTNAKIASEYDRETSANTNTVIAGEGEDFVMGSKASDIIYGDFKTDAEYGYFGSYDDTLYGNGGADGVNGGRGTDRLYGGSGADIIDGGDGDDILVNAYSNGVSDNESDSLKGGEGFDQYVSGNMDVINDSDGKGKVYFERTLLAGGLLTSTSGTKKIYTGDGGTYTLDGDSLTFTKDGKILTIDNYHQDAQDLQIDLHDHGQIKVNIGSASAGENAQRMNFTVSIISDFTLDKPLSVHTSVGSVTIPAGKNSGTVTYTWQDNCAHDGNRTINVTMSGFTYDGFMEVVKGYDGRGTIYDDDVPPADTPCGTSSCTNRHAPCPPPPPRHDPLVLDINRDGEISTVSLADSTAYFDITGIFTANITKQSNNNSLQQNTFTFALKCDIINKCFYTFNKKAA